MLSLESSQEVYTPKYIGKMPNLKGFRRCCLLSIDQPCTRLVSCLVRLASCLPGRAFGLWPLLVYSGPAPGGGLIQVILQNQEEGIKLWLSTGSSATSRLTALQHCLSTGQKRLECSADTMATFQATSCAGHNTSRRHTSHTVSFDKLHSERPCTAF